MKRSYKIIIALVFILLIMFLRFSNIGSYLNLSFIKSNSAYLLHFVSEHYMLTVILYLLMMTAVVALSIPISILLTITSGFFFGAIPGAFYSLCAATMGATLSFLLFRYLLRDSVQDYYGAALKNFNKEISKNGAWYLLSLQLFPLTPFGLITILSALSELSSITFILTTFIGIMPGSLIYAFAGKQLMSIKDMHDIWTFPFISALLLLVLVSALPLIIRFIQAKTKK